MIQREIERNEGLFVYTSSIVRLMRTDRGGDELPDQARDARSPPWRISECRSDQGESHPEDDGAGSIFQEPGRRVETAP